MKLTDQTPEAQQHSNLPMEDDPMRTWLTRIFLACVFVMLVMGVISSYLHVTNEKSPYHARRF